MDGKFLAEVGVNVVVGVAVFAWVFGQSPIPAPEPNKTAVAEPTVQQSAGRRSDQIPTVPTASLNDIEIKIESSALLAPTAPAQEVNSASALLTVVATSLKLREEPTSKSRLVAAYPRGATFEKLGQDGNWVQVRSTNDGTSGWMYANFLEPAN